MNIPLEEKTKLIALVKTLRSPGNNWLRHKMSSSEDEDVYVRTKISGLIEANRVVGNDNMKYFIRPFYRECFQYLVEKLNHSYCNLTCTGTPGIGKSVFIHFFIEEYFKIKPNAHFLLSTFSSEGEHRSSQWIFCTNGSLQLRAIDTSLKTPVEEKLGLPDGALIYLFDGWSKLGMPAYTNQLVAFPSPNYQWFKENAKSSFDVVYFPLWTFDELDCANERLQLGIDDTTLAQRYYKFGGTARFSLTKDLKLYTRGVVSLDKAFSTYFKSYEGLLDAFTIAKEHLATSAELLRLCHRLFYYVPSQDFESCRTILGSTEIIERFDTLISNLKTKERNQLVRSLEVGFAGSIVGRLFEVFVYEKLVQGIQLNMRPLLDKNAMETGGNEEKEVLKILTNSCFWISKNQPPRVFNAVLIPDNPNMESVDGAYVDDVEKILYMFQITIRNAHEESGNGLIKLAEMVQKAEAVARGEFEPRLVFIVPEEIEANFSKQLIKEVSIGISENFDPLKPLEFGIIKDLQRRSVAKLIKEGAKTLGDLKVKFDAGLVQYKTLEDFFRPRNQDLIKKMSTVKQFVVGLEFPDDNKEF
jgi:hypothetical protein